jgi:hypothetical protein
MIIRLPFAPQAIHVQAARVLDEILLIVPIYEMKGKACFLPVFT